MNKHLEKKLVEKYPKLFRDYNESATKSCMAFGCECGDGWYKLINELFGKITAACPETVLLQVKEKFGLLRIYVSCGTDEVYDMIDEYEDMSGHICEGCGEPGECLPDGGWLTTLCDKCRGNGIKKPADNIELADSMMEALGFHRVEK